MFLSLMRVNFYSKNGSAIPKSSNMFLRFRDHFKSKRHSYNVCLEIINSVNTITEKNLKTIFGINTYQKAINSKRGNLEKAMQLTLNIILFKLLEIKYKKIVAYLYFYLKKFSNLVNFNLLYSSSEIQEFKEMHEGKISEKASSFSYSKYTMFYMYRRTHIRQKLNSPGLKKNSNYFKRHYSLVKDESQLTIILIKRQLKDKDGLIWPDNKKLKIIRKEVVRQQMEC